MLHEWVKAFKGNSARTKGCGAAPRGWISLAYSDWNAVFRTLCCYLDVSANFWPLRKHEKKSRAIFQDFFNPGKWTFGSRFWVTRPKILHIMVFFEYPTEKVASSELWLLFLASEQSHVNPVKSSSSHLENNVFWVHMRFPWHKTDQQKTKNCQCYTFGKVSRKTSFRNFWSCHFGLQNPSG